MSSPIRKGRSRSSRGSSKSRRAPFGRRRMKTATECPLARESALPERARGFHYRLGPVQHIQDACPGSNLAPSAQRGSRSSSAAKFLGLAEGQREELTSRLKAMPSWARCTLGCGTGPQGEGDESELRRGRRGRPPLSLLCTTSRRRVDAGERHFALLRGAARLRSPFKGRRASGPPTSPLGRSVQLPAISPRPPSSTALPLSPNAPARIAPLG